MILSLIPDQTPKGKLEALINGKLFEYDACIKGDLEASKAYYKYLKYIGSSTELFVNRKPIPQKEVWHFFVRTSDHDLDDTEPNI